MPRSNPTSVRRGGPGALYSLPTLQRLVLGAAGVAELDCSAARLLLRPWGQPLPHDQFARVWRGDEHLGPARAAEVLGVANAFRGHAGRAPAPPGAHIVPYLSCVILQGPDRNRVEEYLDDIRGACNVSWSDSMLIDVLKNRYLVSAPVAVSIAVGATAVALPAVAMDVPHNTEGKAVNSALKRENNDYLLAQTFGAFPY